MLDVPLTLYDPKSSWPKSDFERRAGVMADFLVVIEFLRNEKKIKWAQLKLTLIENDHLGDWSPEKDCCWRLTRLDNLSRSHLQSQVLLKIDSEDGFCVGCRNVSRQQQSFSGFQSPRCSFSIKVRYSWVQIIFFQWKLVWVINHPLL